MKALPVQYSDLNTLTLITIFQLADLLKVTPKIATTLYFESRVIKANNRRKTSKTTTSTH